MRLGLWILKSELGKVNCFLFNLDLIHLLLLTVVVVQDHIALPNLTGPLNPLLGPLSRPDSQRFIPLSSAYSPSLRRLAFLAAHKLGFDPDDLIEGVYAWVSGPTYETPAEGRFLRSCGATVVGMSTVPEVVVARDEGMDVCVLSLVTNKVVIPDNYRSIKSEVEAEVSKFKVVHYKQL
jgi:purine-nucleoside phosphorylase